MSTVYELLAGDTVCCVYIEGKLNFFNEKLAPLYLEDIEEWISSRAIDSNRGLTARNLKSASGISPNEGNFLTAMKNNAICFTDNYWVREQGSGLSYNDVCFDTYDGFFSRLSMGLDHTYVSYLSDRLNPELTSIGNSDKAWIIDEQGVRWLYKKQPINECYNEVLASRLAEKLGIKTAYYELVFASDPDPDLGRFGIVRSRDFTQGKDVNLEHANLILRHFGIGSKDVFENAKVFDAMGLVHDYLDMIYLDIITGNPDRHEFNYGVLRNRADGSVAGMAPGYDYNFAFFAHTMDTEEFVKAAKEYGWKRPDITKQLIDELQTEMRSIEGFAGYENEGAIRSILTRSNF